jgi:hypothetical protein
VEKSFHSVEKVFHSVEKRRKIFHGVEKVFHSVDNVGFGPRMALVPAGLALRQSVRGARAFHAVENLAKKFPWRGSSGFLGFGRVA